MHLALARQAGRFVIVVLLLLSACAFDVIILQKTPAQLVALPESGERWTLWMDMQATLPAGRVSGLRSLTVWQRVGTLDQGEVFRTKDQIVTVEASNIYQADIVVSGGKLVGFYLPVDHMFTRCTTTAPLSLAKNAG